MCFVKYSCNICKILRYIPQYFPTKKAPMENFITMGAVGVLMKSYVLISLLNGLPRAAGLVVWLRDVNARTTITTTYGSITKNS